MLFRSLDKNQSIFKTAKNASCGTSTFPTWRIRFLPFFCFSKSLRLRLISKVTPIFSKVETKNVRYTLGDNFLSFWFRFIYKYSYMVEIGSYEQLKEIIVRDYTTFSGRILERYFRALYIEQKHFSRIGGYWDRKGENEIDLIAINELDKTAEIIEIKRNPSNIDLDKLQEKSIQFRHTTGELSDYNIELKALSMRDM